MGAWRWLGAGRGWEKSPALSERSPAKGSLIFETRVEDSSGLEAANGPHRALQWLLTADSSFSPSTIEEMEKKRQAFGLGFFFFFFNGSFGSNLHLRGRETIFCYHSISLKFKNSWGYFSWFIKFTSFQRNLPADLSLPQRLGLQECAGSWMPSTWVHCFGLSLWSFMLEYLFFLRVKEERERNRGIEMNLSSQFFPFWR